MGSTIDAIGNYCGRFDAGWLGEPQNSFTNASFLVAAAIAFAMWRRAGARDWPALVLIAMAAAVGVGSFIFHSHPTHATLPIDLIPIQVFTLCVVAFGARRWIAAGWLLTAFIVVLFGAANVAWGRIAHGVLGGGGHHLFALAAIAICGAWLVRRPPTRRSGRFLLVASGTYAVAIAVRAFDIPICGSFPLGLHWLWHLIQGATVGLLLAAALAAPCGTME